MKTNPINWFEIPAQDIERAKVFYEKILDCELTLNEMGPLKMAWFPMEQGAAGATGSLVQHEMYTPSHQGSMVFFCI